ncbi:hypothetical protein SHELI_v1c06260 [Spiroplasma helicoides]|uniref:Uncharacterized protein n=1 Tax=Spiroplasma helicoides TaxID=216938 RepID=A0A1B3SKY4_9MOLU|nr:hypothetical protein [Spiroplasma helicoides]AOG60577.1 hypothetical protein SHELI_v1c06260 [Spiroplasma helicoides]
MILWVSKFFISFSLTFSSYSQVFLVTKNCIYQSSRNDLKNISTKQESYNYKDLLINEYDLSGNISVNKFMFYGRILKYYYANSVTDISAKSLNTFNSWINSITNDQNNYISSHVIQNYIASTFNISVYGSTNDREFFAEAFAKWLLTPDAIKNKSWEVTNNFFLNVMPKLIDNGGMLVDKQNDIKQNVLSSISTKYNLELSDKTSDLNLGYENLNYVGWQTSTYYQNASTRILSDCNLSKNNLNGSISLILNKWMNDSFTKASESSLTEFKNFNTSFFKDYNDLNEKLKDSIKDANQNSMIWLSSLFSAIEAKYTRGFSKNVDYIGSWTSDTTYRLKAVVLKLYNYLYSIIKNESWVYKVIYALIISPDYPLESDDGKNLEGVLGYTLTEGQSNPNTINNSYIVITGRSLLYKDYNSQYTVGWFSSPEMFNTIVHEMGHALDAFGGRINSYRNKDDTQYYLYNSLYKGKYFEDKNPSFIDDKNVSSGTETGVPPKSSNDTDKTSNDSSSETNHLNALIYISIGISIILSVLVVWFIVRNIQKKKRV